MVRSLVLTGVLAVLVSASVFRRPIFFPAAGGKVRLIKSDPRMGPPVGLLLAGFTFNSQEQSRGLAAVGRPQLLAGPAELDEYEGAAHIDGIVLNRAWPPHGVYIRCVNLHSRRSFAEFPSDWSEEEVSWLTPDVEGIAWDPSEWVDPNPTQRKAMRLCNGLRFLWDDLEGIGNDLSPRVRSPVELLDGEEEVLPYPFFVNGTPLGSRGLWWPIPALGWWLHICHPESFLDDDEMLDFPH